MLDELLGKNELELVIRQVSHCFFSNALVIQDLKRRKKYAYSGDRFAGLNQDAEFMAACRDCDVLIHESTYNDSQYQRAYSRQHSTFGQAIAFAMRCKAKKTVLTHFSNANMQEIKGVVNLDGSVNKANLLRQLNLAKHHQPLSTSEFDGMSGRCLGGGGVLREGRSVRVRPHEPAGGRPGGAGLVVEAAVQICGFVRMVNINKIMRRFLHSSIKYYAAQ